MAGGTLPQSKGHFEMPVADPDDEFHSIIDGLDIPEPTDVVDVGKLTDLQLVELLGDTREDLIEDGEMLADLGDKWSTKDSTPEGRALHSLRAACLIELRRRGLR